jgi:hypothetical protein
MRTRVRVGKCYCYEPVLFDIANPPPGRPKRGDVVCVARVRGAPPPGTMGMVHITDRKGNLLGLVFANSLQPWAGKNGCAR